MRVFESISVEINDFEITPKTYKITDGVRVHVTHTQKFEVGNVTFFKDCGLIPRVSTLTILLTED